jgi:hypothetical protein
MPILQEAHTEFYQIYTKRRARCDGELHSTLGDQKSHCAVGKNKFKLKNAHTVSGSKWFWLFTTNVGNAMGLLDHPVYTNPQRHILIDKPVYM